jgi:hypothetical protein
MSAVPGAPSGFTFGQQSSSLFSLSGRSLAPALVLKPTASAPTTATPSMGNFSSGGAAPVAVPTTESNSFSFGGTPPALASTATQPFESFNFGAPTPAPTKVFSGATTEECQKPNVSFIFTPNSTGYDFIPPPTRIINNFFCVVP